jgi:hypothetical protein
MANPTFNINDLVNPLGRQLAAPFAYPSLAQQGQMTRQPAPTTPPTQAKPTGQAGPAPIAPSPTLTPKIPIPFYAGSAR